MALPKREILSREAILDTAEDVLRRFGPTKATVVDVAKALGVSHGTVYRHFESKAALRDAVTERWLERGSEPLTAIANGKGSAVKRLRRWFEELMGEKRRRLFDDPELFATYIALAAEAREVVARHVDALLAQVTYIIADGMSKGEFTVTDAAAAARALLSSTARFHHPAHAAEWDPKGIDPDFEDVWKLTLSGLTAGSKLNSRP